MSESREAREGHPAGDRPSAVREVAREAVKVDTFGGTVHVEWDPDAAATPLGHLVFFAEYLKVSGRFDALVADCPLHYTSPNAPSKRDVLGTVLLSALAGQWRYAHITALRGDGVNPTASGRLRRQENSVVSWSTRDRAVAGAEPVPRGVEMAPQNLFFAHPVVGEETIRRLRAGPVQAGQRDALSETGLHALDQLTKATVPNGRRQDGSLRAPRRTTVPP